MKPHYIAGIRIFSLVILLIQLTLFKQILVFMKLLLFCLPVITNLYRKVSSDIHERHIFSKNIKPNDGWDRNLFCKNGMSPC